MLRLIKIQNSFIKVNLLRAITLVTVLFSIAPLFAQITSYHLTIYNSEIGFSLNVFKSIFNSWTSAFILIHSLCDHVNYIVSLKFEDSTEVRICQKCGRVVDVMDEREFPRITPWPANRHSLILVRLHRIASETYTFSNAEETRCELSTYMERFVPWSIVAGRKEIREMTGR